MPDIPVPAVVDNRRLAIIVKGSRPLRVGTRVVAIREGGWPVELKIPGIPGPVLCRVASDRSTGLLRVLEVEIFQGPMFPW